MRIALALIACTYVSACTANAARPTSQPTTRSLAIVLETQVPKDRLSAGDPVVVIARLHNTGTQRVWFFDTWTERDFDLKVTDLRGRELPRTRFGQRPRIYDLHLTGNVPMALRPGEHLNYRLMPSLFYDMTEPGTYIVRVQRRLRIFDPDTIDQPLECDPVEISVIDRRSPVEQ